MVGRNFPLSLVSPGFALAAVLAFGLGGCADFADTAGSLAFADPAKYTLYDCKKLEVERTVLANRTAELKGLIEKARTGTGGTVVAELAYRNEYITTRASARLAEDAWSHYKCTAAAAAPAATTPATAAAGAAPAPPKFGSALY